MTLIISEYLVRLERVEVCNWGAYFNWWYSRTIEWEEMEWINADPPWPEFFQENAL